MRFCLMIILALVIFSLIMCGDKGTNPSYDSNLVGTWIYDSTCCNDIRDDHTYNDSMKFDSNGKGSLFAEPYVNGTMNISFFWETRASYLKITFWLVNGIPFELTDDTTSANYQINDSTFSMTNLAGNGIIFKKNDCTSYWTLRK